MSEPTTDAPIRPVTLTPETVTRARLLLVAGLVVSLDRRSRAKWFVMGASAARYWHGLIGDHRRVRQVPTLADAVRLLPAAALGRDR